MEEKPAIECRGVRGAISLDGPGAVREATRTLLDALTSANGWQLEEVAAAVFTVTADLAGANPAAEAREHGWSAVPFLVVREGADWDMAPRLRVLVLWNTTKTQAEVRHVYLRDAAALRPDLPATG